MIRAAFTRSARVKVDTTPSIRSLEAWMTFGGSLRRATPRAWRSHSTSPSNAHRITLG